MNRLYVARLAAACAMLVLSGTSVADELQDVRQLLKQGQQAQAGQRIDAYLARHPKDAQAQFLKGVILSEQNRTNEAIAVFTALTRDYPELPEPYNNLAVLYASQGQYEKAKAALEQAIRTHPSYATAHENLGDIYAKMASQAYDKALQIDRNNPGAQTKLALIHDLFSTPRGKAPAVIAQAPRPAAPPAAAPQPPVAAPPVVAAKPAVTPPPAPVATPAIPAKPAVTPPPPAPAASPAIPAKPAAPAPTPPTQVAKAAPTPVPPVPAAAKPEPAKPAKPAADAKSDEKELLAAVQSWADAWSSKNVNNYLSFYAKEFKTPGGESRAAWEKSRRDRISRPKSIRVGISGASVHIIDDTHAAVKFRQSYHASGSDAKNTTKTLVLVKQGKRWLIQEERVPG